MAYSSKKILYYGSVGVILAVLIIMASYSPLILSIFQVRAKTGTLLIKLIDAPVDLEELWVNITSLEAQSIEQGWRELEFIEDKQYVWIDILKLQNKTMLLSISEVPTGNYTKIRMYVNAASANFTESDGEPEGDLVALTVPSDKIDIILKYQIIPGETTELLIDMQADWVAVSKNHRLRPVLKATVWEQPSP